MTDAEGIVGFDAALQQYIITRAQPGTYDSVDIGVVCGALPASLQVAGTKMLFSSAYQAYGNPPNRPSQAAPARIWH